MDTPDSKHPERIFSKRGERLKILNVRVSMDQKRALHAAAKKRGITTADLVPYALDQWLRNN